jgi:hypothetical protein
MSDEKFIQLQKLLKSFEILEQLANTVVIDEYSVQVNHLIRKFEDLIQGHHSTDLFQILVEILHDILASTKQVIFNRNG